MLGLLLLKPSRWCWCKVVKCASQPLTVCTPRPPVPAGHTCWEVPTYLGSPGELLRFWLNASAEPPETTSTLRVWSCYFTSTRLEDSVPVPATVWGPPPKYHCLLLFCILLIPALVEKVIVDLYPLITDFPVIKPCCGLPHSLWQLPFHRLISFAFLRTLLIPPGLPAQFSRPLGEKRSTARIFH